MSRMRPQKPIWDHRGDWWEKPDTREREHSAWERWWSKGQTEMMPKDWRLWFPHEETPENILLQRTRAEPKSGWRMSGFKTLDQTKTWWLVARDWQVCPEKVLAHQQEAHKMTWAFSFLFPHPLDGTGTYSEYRERAWRKSSCWRLLRSSGRLRSNKLISLVKLRIHTAAIAKRGTKQ